jgi:N-acetylmuramoyl-L-alanine amidase
MKNVKPGHSKPIVCLDAGHYGKYNRSKVVPEYYESDMVWKLHLKLKAELEKYGIEVKTTRKTKDMDLGLDARGKVSKDCDLFLSLHSNAADSESVNYVVCMHQIDDNCPIDDVSKELAGKLSKCVAGIMGGVKAQTWSKLSSTDRDGNGYKDDYYGVLRGAHTVGTAGVIIEHGFHTNTAQAKWLLVEANLDKLAKAEAALIAEYYGMTKAAEEPEHLYRIRKTWEDAKSQTGAYKSLDGAKKACPVGYSVYDWNGKAVYTNNPAPVVTTYTLTLPVLKKGDKGDHVKAVQQLLLANKISLAQYGADGSFGGVTEAGVIAFQKAVGIDADGEVGRDTMSKLLGV